MKVMPKPFGELYDAEDPLQQLLHAHQQLRLYENENTELKNKLIAVHKPTLLAVCLLHRVHITACLSLQSLTVSACSWKTL